VYRVCRFGDFPLGFGSKILNLRLAIKWAIFKLKAICLPTVTNNFEFTGYLSSDFKKKVLVVTLISHLSIAKEVIYCYIEKKDGGKAPCAGNA
jgi:hypothetical protein